MKRRLNQIALIGAVGLSLCAGASKPASAEGFFDFLFGGGPRRSAPPPQSSSNSQPSSAYADPASNFEEERPARRSESATYATYCVRLCDGHFFPIQKHAGTTPAQACNAFCPAAQTKIYSGNGIANAVATDGRRYDDLENAFVYREKIVTDCTCNGKDALGLAHVDVKTDSTLRPGDIVATRNGLMAYTRGKKSAGFTPLSGEAQKKLAAVKIAPSPIAAAEEEASQILPLSQDRPTRPERRRAASR